jgi:hypothetical protein
LAQVVKNFVSTSPNKNVIITLTITEHDCNKLLNESKPNATKVHDITCITFPTSTVIGSDTYRLVTLAVNRWQKLYVQSDKYIDGPARYCLSFFFAFTMFFQH